MSPLSKLSPGARNINILHGGSFVCLDPVLWKSYDQQEMNKNKKQNSIAFVVIDFSGILKTDHLSQTKSQPHSDQNPKRGTSRRTLKTQLSSATAEWKAQIKTGNHLLSTNMLCSWLTCQLIKNASVQAAVSFKTLNPFMVVNTNVFHRTQPRTLALNRWPRVWASPLPWYAFLLIWWLAFLINGHRKCWALHGIPSSSCFPEAWLWKKPAPEAKQRRSLKFPILCPSSCS